MRSRAITLGTSSENNGGAPANHERTSDRHAQIIRHFGNTIASRKSLMAGECRGVRLDRVFQGRFKFPDRRVEGFAGSLISREPVMTSAPFECKPRFAESLAFEDSGSSMPIVKLCASRSSARSRKRGPSFSVRPWCSQTEKPGRWKTSGLMNCTACEFRSGVTLESGPSPLSSLRRARPPSGGFFVDARPRPALNL
jgi:hypothetical protein